MVPSLSVGVLWPVSRSSNGSFSYISFVGFSLLWDLGSAFAPSSWDDVFVTYL